METLLNFIHDTEKEEEEEEESPMNDLVLVVGDLNQQREKDYTVPEWQVISANKKRRKSPLNDGVATLLGSYGFRCHFDEINPSETELNWNPSDPPPSTHWTGTIVDYVYYKTRKNTGTDTKVRGIHVSPRDLSDHRLVVTDLELFS